MTLTSGPSASDERSSGRPLEALENEAYVKALEFAEYMAKGAEQLLAAINEEDLRRMALDDDETACVADVKAYERALMERSEFATGLRSDIYEFRKRAARAAPSGVAGSSAECSEEGLKDSASARRPDGQTGTGGQHEQG